MVNDSSWIASLNERRAECLQCSASLQILPYRPAQDLPAIQIHHGGQEQPAFGRWHIRDVSNPNLIRPSWHRTAEQEVGSNRLIVITIGSADSALAAGPSQRGQMRFGLLTSRMCQR